MKKLLLFCFAVCLNTVLLAQNIYFVYLQTEDQSPFYVRLSDKIYSSGEMGFLILPNLTDSTYILNIGFPKQSEAKFSVTINQNDKGFLIKKSDDGLTLFDLQNTTLIKPDSVAKDSTLYEIRTDAFSLLLAKAADDTTLLKIPVVKKEEVANTAPQQKDTAVQKVDVAKEEVKTTKPQTDTTVSVVEHNATAQKQDTVATVNAGTVPKTDSTAVTKSDTTTSIKTDTIASKTDITASQQIAKDTVQLVKDTMQVSKDRVQTLPPVVKENPVQAKQDTEQTKENPAQVVDYKPSVVVRHSESSTTKGFGAVYFDKQDDRTDTIRILIESSKYKIAPKVDADTTAVKPLKYERVDSLASVKKKNETDSMVLAKNSEIDSATVTLSNNKVAEAKLACKNLATDKDFLKLRKTMAAKETDEAMLDEAKKSFKAKCFSVEQIRSLGSLFLTPEGKYQFFDMAYKYVSDKENFTSLQSEIKDDYFIKRFKALIGE